MRLKTLRKVRPAFEIEGAVINGSRMGLSNSELKPHKHRSDTTFALPTSLNTEVSSLNISPSDLPEEMNTSYRPPVVIPLASQMANIPRYHAIEAACLEHGIRIRLSPTRVATGQQKSANSLQRHTAFVNRNPSRTSSVLHYATTMQDQNDDSRSFSVLQQMSSTDFHQSHVHNVSYNQSSRINEDYYASSLIASEQSHLMTPPEKLSIINARRSTSALFQEDPDLAYISSLLKKTNGDTVRDTIRRRAGLRGTLAVHRNPLSSNTNQQPREKSPVINQNSLIRHTTIAVAPKVSTKQIDRDILKHASRIRTSQSRDYSTKSLRIDSTSITSSPRKTDNYRRNSINKPLKSMSLEPLELLLTPAPRTASLSSRDLPSIHKPSTTRHLKTPAKRAKTAIVENQNTQSLLSREHLSSSSILRDESLALMKTSSLDIAPQSNSFDSGCYDRSSSGGDVQSLTSSSLIQMPSSIPSARLASSTTRRSNTNKKVSFYEEPTTVILTTATYV